MSKLRKRFVPMMAFFLVVSILFGSNVAYAAKDSYSYSIWEEAQKAPAAYQWEQSVRASDIGVKSLSKISDLYAKNGLLYITCSGKVVITDEEFNLVNEITTYVDHGVEGKISAPNGIFVTNENEIYITEPEKGLILHFDAKHNFVRALKDPKIEGLESIKYQPMKVVVDSIGRIYVLAKSVYEGIIELDPNGNFNRFVGANEVSLNMVEIFWRAIATEEQRARMELVLPTDYSDIAIDEDGFLLATVRDTSSPNPIRRLNAKGEDIMQEYEHVQRPSGDFKNGSSISVLTTVSASKDGRFAVLDSLYSRVFVYSEDARLLYILGGNGRTEGSFNSPVDLVFMKDKILVADLVTQSIEVFSPTEYGALINKAAHHQTKYEYKEAANLWEQVLLINPNFNYGNIGIGKQALRDSNYEKATSNFYNSRESEYYSTAYENVREAHIDENFGVFVGIIAFIFIFFAVLKQVKKYRKKHGLTFKGTVADGLRAFQKTWISEPMYALSHPFKWFDDMKYVGTGNVKFSVGVLVVLCIVNIYATRNSSFLVNNIDISKVNSLMVVATTVVPYMLFVIANWTITTLMDGKGTFKHIFMVNMYALYPMVFLQLIGTFLSNYIISDEVPMILFFFGLGMFLYVFYTFVGLVVVHGFTFTKGVASVALTFVSMLLIMFVSLLLLTLVGGFVDDIYTMYYEITLRL